MSGPFNIGDVVVCVDDGPIRFGAHKGKAFSIRQGALARVSKVIPHSPFVVLHFFGVRSNYGAGGFGAHRFRHLPKADEQFTEQMRALKPIRKQVKA